MVDYCLGFQNKGLRTFVEYLGISGVCNKVEHFFELIKCSSKALNQNTTSNGPAKILIPKSNIKKVWWENLWLPQYWAYCNCHQQKTAHWTLQKFNCNYNFIYLISNNSCYFIITFKILLNCKCTEAHRQNFSVNTGIV